MCTLSIFNKEDEIIITMNRDENRHREEEKKLLDSNNNINKIRAVYPVDLQAGGSWFGCNEYGLVLAILNRYQDPVFKNRSSRGEIIPLLLGFKDIPDILIQLDKMKMLRYNPFDLIIISSQSRYRFSWNGESTKLMLLDIEHPYFISSSFVDRNSVLSWRENFFDKVIQKKLFNKISASNILRNIHLQQLATDKSKSIFMSREHSHTKSICQAQLSKKDLNFIYYPQNSLKKLQQSEITDNFQTITFKLIL